MSTETPTTPFSQQLAYLGKGEIDADATQQLAELVQMVRLTGKKGTLTVTVEVSMLDKSSENAMRVKADVKSKPPAPETPTTVMFSTHDGDMLRDDPEQLPITFKEVSAPQQQVRGVDAPVVQPKTVTAE